MIHLLYFKHLDLVKAYSKGRDWAKEDEDLVKVYFKDRDWAKEAEDLVKEYFKDRVRVKEAEDLAKYVLYIRVLSNFSYKCPDVNVCISFSWRT